MTSPEAHITVRDLTMAYGSFVIQLVGYLCPSERFPWEMRSRNDGEAPIR
jgi:hypothetical protein